MTVSAACRAFLFELGPVAPALLVSILPAFAEPAAGQGWQLMCAAEQKCEMKYAQAADGRDVTRLLVYKVGKQPVVEYLVPLGVDLQRGVFLQVDGKYTVLTAPLYCDAPGCVGYARLTPELLDHLKRGRLLRLAFSPHGGKDFYGYTYPLDGFTVQYGAFLKGAVPPPAGQP